MAELLQAPNFDLSNLTAFSYLASDVVAGQNAAAVLNIESFVPTSGFVLYDKGEQSEAYFTNSISNEQLIIPGNFLFNHRHGTTVKQLFGDVVQFWRAPALSDNTPPPLANFSYLASANILPDQLTTGYLDPLGGSAYWYIFLYYNSITTLLTSTSNAVPVRGGGYGNYCSLSDIVIKAGLDPLTTDMSIVSQARAAAQSEVKGALSSAGYTMPLQTGSQVFFVPDHVAEITRLLAAGIVLFNNYSITKPSAAKDGQMKMDEARQMLVKVQLRDTMLLDFNEQVLAMTGLVSGWPDNTTVDDPHTNLPGPTVTMDKIF